MLALLFLLLFWALTFDILFRRIPNGVILIGVGCGLAGSFYSLGGLDITHALLGMLVGFGLFVLPYSKSLLGAGDVKLLAMVGIYLGPRLTMMAALYTLLAGGLVAIFYAFYKGVMKHSLNNIVELKAGVSQIPYSIAISLGTFCAVYQNGLR
jgi:prepilin peptidase CpaA